MSRSPLSRVGAVASDQSKVLVSRSILMDRVATLKAEYGDTMPRPAFWGGVRIRPLELEYWADGEARLHDRFRWMRSSQDADWNIDRLYP